MIGIAVGQLILGPLSDARDRRRLLLLLLGSTLVCALASSLARAIAADVASGVTAARLFSLFMTLSSVAPIVAPVLGGLMLALTGSWQPMFYLLAAISLALAAVSWSAIRKPSRWRTGIAAGCGKPDAPSSGWPRTGCSPATR